MNPISSCLTLLNRFFIITFIIPVLLTPFSHVTLHLHLPYSHVHHHHSLVPPHILFFVANFSFCAVHHFHQLYHSHPVPNDFITVLLDSLKSDICPCYSLCSVDTRSGPATSLISFQNKERGLKNRYQETSMYIQRSNFLWINICYQDRWSNLANIMLHN